MKFTNSIEKQQLVFTKWTRKSYAIFASLNKEVQIGHLSSLICDSLVATVKSFVSFFSRIELATFSDKQHQLAISLQLNNMSSYLTVLGLVSTTDANELTIIDSNKVRY